jgi:dihydrofolate synthase/folylpolyglutamate synthase
LAGLESDRRSTPDRLDRPFEDPILYELFPALATNVEWGLERMQRALAMLGDPHLSYSSLHIGGTNGKGSVTATLASISRAAGHRSGTYVSPHLVDFRERMLVDGQPISEGALEGYASEVRDAITRCGLTFFEAVTLLALRVFAREGVQIAALEVGLGGRLDATNVVLPEVSAVTNVGLDHQDYLGDTLLEIAREKAGIVKPGVPFVTTEPRPEVLALFERIATEVGAPMRSVPAEALRDVEITSEGTSFEMRTTAWGDLRVVTPLPGRHQATNAALAVAVCESLRDDLRPTAEALLEGIRTVRHRGRDQVVVLDGTTWLFDVAHNPHGVASLADTLDRLALPAPRVALVGILGDKDWRAMLPPILERCDRAVLTQPPTAPLDRRWDPVEAARSLGDARPSETIEDFPAALARATALAGGGTVVVTGSVHTVGAAMRLLDVAPLG